jgi:hypothetical protein
LTAFYIAVALLLSTGLKLDSFLQYISVLCSYEGEAAPSERKGPSPSLQSPSRKAIVYKEEQAVDWMIG